MTRTTMLIVLMATTVALAVRVYWLTRPGMFLGAPEYDDGEYLGSAIRLASGALPYRDFAFVQPPGITLLLAPLGFLAKATSTATAMAVARILAACVGAAGVALAGILVRHRGALAVTVTCGILAVFPDAVGASSTLFLEPWVVLLILLAAVSAFEGDHLTASRRRLIVSGVLIGFATAVKVWAAMPLLVLAVLVLIRVGPRRATPYLGGVIAGFCVPVLPFALIAPRAFWDNVIGSQLHQTDVTSVSHVVRLLHMDGLNYLSVGRTGVLLITVVLVGAVVLSAALASVLSRSAPPPLEWWALGTAAGTAIAFMVPMEFFPHYSAFFAPFLALSLGLPIGRAAAVWSQTRRGSEGSARTRGVLTAALTAAAASALVAMAVTDLNREAGLRAISPAAALDRQIPAHACVITDNSAFTVVANRFLSDVPGCTQMVDATGTDMALGNGRNALTGAGRYAAVEATWMTAFRHAQFVYLSCGPARAARCHRLTNRRIPWTRPIWAYFTRHFKPVGRVPGVLYARRPARHGKT